MAQSKSRVRWNFILLSVVFFLVSKYVMLRTQFKPVFTLFSQFNKDDGYACLDSWNGTPWNIVLNVAYPWLGRLVNQQPLSQDQADFLWMAIRSNWIPTQDQINAQSAQWQSTPVTPLGYLCGDILKDWTAGTGKTLSDVAKDPEHSPWLFFLSSDPSAPSKILTDTNALNILCTTGLWGIAKYLGSSGTSPADMYNAIYAKSPPPPSCSTATSVASVASTGATFSMAGAAFGPEGSSIGALVGAGLGLGLGAFEQKSQCGTSSACAIM